MKYIETLSTSDPHSVDPIAHFDVRSSWTVDQLVAVLPTGRTGEHYWRCIDEMRGNDIAPSQPGEYDRDYEDLADLDSAERMQLLLQMRADPELHTTVDPDGKIVEGDVRSAAEIEWRGNKYRAHLHRIDRWGDRITEPARLVAIDDEVAAAISEAQYSLDRARGVSLRLARHNRDVDLSEDRHTPVRDGRANMAQIIESEWSADERKLVIWNEESALEARALAQLATVTVRVTPPPGRWSDAVVEAYCLSEAYGQDVDSFEVDLDGPGIGLAATRAQQDALGKLGPFDADQILADWYAERHRPRPHRPPYEQRWLPEEQRGLPALSSPWRPTRMPGDRSRKEYLRWHDQLSKAADRHQLMLDRGLEPIWTNEPYWQKDADGKWQDLGLRPMVRYVRPKRSGIAGNTSATPDIGTWQPKPQWRRMSGRKLHVYVKLHVPYRHVETHLGCMPLWARPRPATPAPAAPALPSLHGAHSIADLSTVAPPTEPTGEVLTEAEFEARFGYTLAQWQGRA